MIVQQNNRIGHQCYCARNPVMTTNIEPHRICRVKSAGDDPLGQDTRKNVRNYPTMETVDQSLRTPWALDYEIQRQPIANDQGKAAVHRRCRSC
jgi:hypothetical protein